MRGVEDQVAIVTGGTFGVGRGIARALAQYGACVFVTGRSVLDDALKNENITGIHCDHRVDAEVSAAFERMNREAGRSTSWSTMSGAATSGWLRTGCSL